MHKFLPAIGFSGIQSNRDMRTLLDACLHFPEASVLCREEGLSCGTLSKSYGDRFGLRLYVEYEAGKQLREEYYFPYADSDEISSTASCTVERKADRNAYVGMTEESTLGMSLIFFLSNGIEYAKRLQEGTAEIRSISLTGLSLSGKILLPLAKTEQQRALVTAAQNMRSRLLEAAMDGDAGAMENLTISDMNLSQNINARIYDEDIYSLVDTSLMPCGLESDRYTAVGEILTCESVGNLLTGEQMWRMLIECCDIKMHIQINKRDLFGIPAVGRRFKGEIWLQGRAEF